MSVNARVRETETRRTVTITRSAAVKAASSRYWFFPRIAEVTYTEHVAPGVEYRVDVKLSGPILHDDGTVSDQWISRSFLGDLGIDGGPKWIREIVEAFRPVQSIENMRWSCDS